MEIDNRPAPTCTVIRKGTHGAQTGRQHQTFFEGISTRSTGASALCLHLVVIGPGEQTAAHLHEGHETAIYFLSGATETWYGPGLESRLVSAAGDFLYIPAGCPHLARNLSDTEPCQVLVARTDPDEQASVVLLPALEGRFRQPPGRAPLAAAIAPAPAPAMAPAP